LGWWGDQVLVVPLGAGQHPLAALRGLVPVQVCEERERESAKPAGPSPFRNVTSVAQATVSALFGWHPADQGDQCLVSRGVDRPVDHLRRGWGGFPRAPRSRRPIMGGPDGPTFEAATTIRAHVRQDRGDAVAAERAFICTAHRVGRVGRERAVAVLARGPELEHVAVWHRARASRRLHEMGRDRLPLHST
jgi:hypothetical protein